MAFSANLSTLRALTSDRATTNPVAAKNTTAPIEASSNKDAPAALETRDSANRDYVSFRSNNLAQRIKQAMGSMRG